MANLFKGKKFFLVGIKGTGLSSLALYLKLLGSIVSGSDIKTTFNTDQKLKENKIKVFESFDEEFLPVEIDYLIYSAAYNPKTNSQIASAIKRGVAVFSYPQWLSYLTTVYPSYGISGTHGKTTTAALVDFLLYQKGINSLSLYGSKLDLEKKGQLEELLVLEACEYRDHFLLYNFETLLITTVDFDHPDYFNDENEIIDSFKKVIKKLKKGSLLICANDNSLTKELISWINKEKIELELITYGFELDSTVVITDFIVVGNKGHFKINNKIFSTNYNNKNLILNSVGAALLATKIMAKDEQLFSELLALTNEMPQLQGRLEVLFEQDKVTYIDDYAHHPTEIVTSIDQLKKEYPNKKILLVFYPHTLSRTIALFDDFAKALKNLDQLFIRPIYPSQRDDGDKESLINLAKLLAKATKGVFVETEEQLIKEVATALHSDYLCVTMGAGNNTNLAAKIATFREKLTC